MVNKKSTIIPTTEQVLPIFFKKKLHELGIGLGGLVAILILVFSTTPIGMFTGSFFFENDCSNYEKMTNFNSYCSDVDAQIMGILTWIVFFLIILFSYIFILFNWRYSKIEAYNKLNPDDEVSSWNSYREDVLKEDVGDYW